MPFTPVSASDPVAPLENILNTRFTELDNSITASVANFAIKTYKWVNAAARAAQTGMAEGDIGDQADTEQRWRYSGSTWVDITNGLFPVIPTSVSVGSGSAAIGPSGKISLNSASTNISVNGCFTSAYDNYLLHITISSSAGGTDLTMRLRNAGADNSTTGASGYSAVSAEFNSTSTTTQQNSYNISTASFITVGRSAGLNIGGVSRIEVFGPALPRYTNVVANSSDSQFFRTQWGSFKSSSTFDGFSILIGSAVTGEIRIYGYNNN